MYRSCVPSAINPTPCIEGFGACIGAICGTLHCCQGDFCNGGAPLNVSVVAMLVAVMAAVFLQME